MKFKKLLLVAIMVASMVAVTACGGTPEAEQPEDNTETPVIDGDVENDGEVEDDAEVENDEEVAIPKDGTYTATAATPDENGEIEVEITVLDSKIQDFNVKGQEGIEIEEATIESFKAAIIGKESPEDIALEEISGDEQEINVLMQASVNAYILSLVG
jgi:uncharacterized protein with FMN-binding domain